MDLAERAIESLPSTRRKLIVECTYRRTSFVPTRDRNKPIRARFSCGIAAHLLHIDAKLSAAEIAAALECNETAAIEHVAYGKRVTEQSHEALLLIGKIRDDVHAELERVGMDVMLDATLSENAPIVIVPLPTSIPKVISFISKTLGVSESLITGVTRKGREVDARHIAMAIAQAIWPDQSHPMIGSFFSGRDGSTVMHALWRVDAVLRGEKDDPDLLRKIGTACERLGWDSSRLHFVEKKSSV